ncbi:phosphotransferase [Isoptericola hypogeus]
MSTAVPSRTRPTWPELPAPVRAAVEARIGMPVTGWTSHDGGYSPGLASTLRTGEGTLFVKAVHTGHEFAARLYREEARRAALLPAGLPTPRFRWSLEVPADEFLTGEGAAGGGWVALAFDTAEARTPRVPWVADELDAVVELATRISEHEVVPGALPDLGTELPTDRTRLLAAELPAGLATYDPWLAEHLDRLAALEADALAAVAGTSLVHGDLRGDNALLIDGPLIDGPLVDGRLTRDQARRGIRALAVDWPNAARGAAFCDRVGMLPATHVEGGPPPEEVLSRRPLPPGTDDDAVTAYVVALTGYFVHSSLQAPPPGIPHVRAYQRAQAEVCIAWLGRRLGG